MKSLTQHNHHIASLFICDDHVGHEFENGSILVQGKYFHICQQVSNEELSHGSIIEKAFVCCSQVSTSIRITGEVYIWVYFHFCIMWAQDDYTNLSHPIVLTWWQFYFKCLKFLPPTCYLQDMRSRIRSCLCFTDDCPLLINRLSYTEMKIVMYRCETQTVFLILLFKKKLSFSQLKTNVSEFCRWVR